MALHTGGLVSRSGLMKPVELPREPVSFERILKFNENHDAHGRFSSGGGKGGSKATGGGAKAKGTGSNATPLPGDHGLPFDINNTWTHPLHTHYDMSTGKVHVPTGETVDQATRDKYKDMKSHPIGTSYSSSGDSTMIPYQSHGDDGYFELETGKVWRTYKP